jgi:hypothetical protein
MLFRPEEIDPASRAGKISFPGSYGDINIGTNVRRILAYDDAISYFHTHGISAVQTRRFDHGCFSWKKPADRQRLESSLSEPFLLPVH